MARDATATVNIRINATDHTGRTLRHVGSAFKTTLGGIRRTVFSLQGALAGLGAGLVARSFVQTAASFETLGVSMETVLGSAKRAQEATSWIVDFTARTPYELDQVSEAFRKLSAYGFDATANLQVLGDTASAMGKGLDQAVEAFADAATGEFERLKEFGIKARTLGDQVTFSWVQNGQQMTRSVRKTGVEITAALREIWGARFSGGMEKLSHTWAGMLSNLKDSWTQFQLEVMRSGVMDVLKNELRAVLERIKELQREGKLKEWAQGVAEGILLAFRALVDVARVVGRLIDLFVGLSPPTRKFVMAASALTVALPPLLVGLGALSAAIGAITAPLALAAAGLAGFTSAIMEVANIWDSIKDFWTSLPRLIVQQAQLLYYGG